MSPAKAAEAFMTALLLWCPTFLWAGETPDSARHWSVGVGFMPGWEIPLDSYERKWLRDKTSQTFSLEVGYTALPKDSDAFAADYNYPIISAGVSFHRAQVTMRRSAEDDWGLAEMVDYDSRLGNSVSLYAKFARPIVRSRHWMVDYAMAFGTAYHHLKYSKSDNIDDELIGARWNIYFGAGLHVYYKVAPSWLLRAGIDYHHHSNGALNRPNKGSNTLGPSIAVYYQPAYETLASRARARYNPPFRHRLYGLVSIGVGGKTLNDDWQRTQFRTEPSASDYRTEKFHVYPVYELQGAVMYRYARRWASGIGPDLFYMSYNKKSNAPSDGKSHSPWSYGLSAHHEVFYHQLSLAMSLGFYLKRDHTLRDRELETPYYERIGVFYTFKKLYGIRFGMAVKAHKTKADYTFVLLSVPIGKP